MNTISTQATNGYPEVPSPPAPGSQQQEQPTWPSQSQAATNFSFPQAMLPIRIDTQAECLPMHQGGGSRAVATIIIGASDHDGKARSRGHDSMDIDGEGSEAECGGRRGARERTAKRVAKKLAKREVERQLKKAFTSKRLGKLIKEHVDQHIRGMDSEPEEAGSEAGGSSASLSSAEAAPSRQQHPSSTHVPEHSAAMRGGGGDRVHISTPFRSPQTLSPSSSSSGRSFTPNSPIARFSQRGRGRFTARPYGAHERASGGEFARETWRQGAYGDGYQSRGAAGIFGLAGGDGGRSYQTFREQNDVDMSDD
ncbi:hypothetical protein RB598_002613 [Gaeumannomyces tritici]